MLHTYWIGTWTNVWSAKAEQFANAIPWKNIYTDNNCGIRAFIANDWHFRLEPYSLYINSHLGREISERYSERQSWTEDISAEELINFFSCKKTNHCFSLKQQAFAHLCTHWAQPWTITHIPQSNPIMHSLFESGFTHTPTLCGTRLIHIRGTLSHSWTQTEKAQCWFNNYV